MNLDFSVESLNPHLLDFSVPQLSGAQTDYVVFFVMVAAALALSKSRLGWPLKWAETFYHELSHGLVCIVTGGWVKRITLRFDGSGVCTSSGGWRVPILLAGYSGAALWGGVLYLAGWTLSDSGGTFWLKCELAVMAVVFILWVRNLSTLIVLGMIAGVYAAAVAIEDKNFIPYILQFMGLYVLLNAIRAPLALIDGEHVGDGAALADIFKVLPEGFWILLWFVFALAVLLFCMMVTLPGFESWFYGIVGHHTIGPVRF